MGTKLQDKQQMLEKGMKVFLLVRNVDGTGAIKKRVAKVLQVLRGAVKIEIDGEKDRVVRLNHIEVDMEEFGLRQKRKIVPNDAAPDLAVAPEPIGSLPVHVPGMDPSIPSATHLQEKVEDDLDTWLNMGRELIEPIKARCLQIEGELRGLAEEYTLIGEQIHEAKEELDTLNAKQRVINGKLQEMEKAS
jgi:hypothetical protein